MYNHPGVFIEEIPSGVRPISAASTSIPIFIGAAKNGPIGDPQFLLTWDDYKTAFGGISDEADALGLSVSSFYANGGGAAYAVRLADGALSSTMPAGEMFGPLGGTMAAANVLSIEAANPGVWGDSVSVQVENSNGQTFTLKVVLTGEEVITETFTNLTMNDKSANFVGTAINNNSQLIRAEYAPDVADGTKFLNGTMTSAAGGNIAYDQVLEGDTLKIEFDNLGAFEMTFPAPTAPGYTQAKVRTAILDAVAALGPQPNYQDFAITAAVDSMIFTSGVANASSKIKVFPGKVASLLRMGPGEGVARNGDFDVVPIDMVAPVLLAGGDDGADPVKGDFQDFMGDALMKLRDVSIIILPGRDYVADKDIVDVAISHCEATKNRMVIVDPPGGTELRTGADVDTLGLSTSTYAVLYYPHLKVSNPFFDPDKNPTAPPTLVIGASGAMAGLWAKIDGRRGVWKAPAGIGTALLGIAGVSYDVIDGIQDQLNPLGINCIRKLPRFNHVVWGARTLATNSVPEWRYVPIRRTAIMIERSVYDGIQWAVFEPNNHILWGSLRLNIETFMDGLFRAGAFQGEKASDAYFVRCGLGDTMTQGDIDAGRVIAIVGFAPLKPAEFVIIRIQQKVGQQ